jgi:hypothetical protein
MKGAIALCLKELVVEKFGKEKWAEAMKNAGFATEPLITMISDMDDAAVMKVIGSVCSTLKITPLQAADAFGDYWVNVYAPKKYSSYYAGITSSKDMLMKMDKVHVVVTQSIVNAHPPRFEYQWTNDNTLVMTYKSSRGLIDIFVGLVKGVGRYYKENLKIRKLSPTDVEIVFP